MKYPLPSKLTSKTPDPEYYSIPEYKTCVLEGRFIEENLVVYPGQSYEIIYGHGNRPIVRMIIGGGGAGGEFPSIGGGSGGRLSSLNNYPVVVDSGGSGGGGGSGSPAQISQKDYDVYQALKNEMLRPFYVEQIFNVIHKD